jgi:hypothetical protein
VTIVLDYVGCMCHLDGRAMTSDNCT